MLAIGESNVERHFVLTTPRRGQVKDPGYVYVQDGFFNWQLYPMLPALVVMHVLHFYGLFLLVTEGRWVTLAMTALFALWSGLGNTAGAHRLWCHRSYQATLPLRIFLMVGHTIGGQFSIYRWAAGHRTHHKYADTDGDPHNVKRGFNFAHLGWMVLKEHPLVDIKAANIDFGDLDKDPVAKFQKDNYYLCYLLFSVALPVAAPMLLLGESFINAFLIGYVMRTTTVTHDTAFVNSAAHMFGERPYNNRLVSSENSWVSIAAIGEGYHNYHHAYPWDYGAGETGNYFNVTKMFIDTMSWLGLAYNLKQASRETIEKSKKRVLNNNCDEDVGY